MTVRAVRLLVAIDTAQAKEFDVLFMEESHHRSFGVRCPIDARVRHGYHRVGDTHHVGRVARLAGHHLPRLRGMADRALCVVTPLAMAIETLTMIRPFESRLPQVVRIGGAAVTFFARGDPSGG